MPLPCRALLAALVLTTPLGAQVTCRPPSGSNEARLIAFAAMPLTYAPLGAPAALPRGAVVLGGDLTYIAEPPSEISRPEFCYEPKDENARLAPVLPRPRLLVGLGGGFALDLTYLPPVTVADATPNFGSVALAYTRAVRGVDLTVRGHATFGSVEGPVTCPEEALTSNPAGPCFGTEPSDDRFTPDVRGVDATVARALGARWRWFAGAGVQRLDSRFRVNFTNGAGGRDDTEVEVGLTRVSLLGGLDWQAAPAVAFTAQLYAVPEDGTTGRVGVRWRLR